MSRSTHTFLLCLAAALLSTTTRAQTVTGNLDGHITDAAGGAVPGVEVIAHGTATGAERATRTNQAGYFEMPFLPIGDYDVTVSLKGFATTVAKGNEVTLNKTTTLNSVSRSRPSRHR